MPVRNVTSACVPNQCSGRVARGPSNPEGSEHIFGFIHSGRCYNTESQAFCEQGSVARFVSGRNVPECVNPAEVNCGDRTGPAIYSLTSGTTNDRCGDGETLSQGGQCVPIAEF